MPSFMRRIRRTFKSPRKATVNDVLANSIDALEAVKNVADAVGVVPFLSAVITAALGIAKVVQEARESEDALVEVARRAAAIVTHIKQKVQSGAGSLAVSTEMQKILAELHAVMENIRAEVEDVLKIVPFVRFLRRKMVQKKGQTCVQKLDDAWRAFDSALLVHLENQVKAQGESLERLEDQNRSQVETLAHLECEVRSQATFEPTLSIPYARFTDIQHKVRQGKYNTSTYSGDQFSGLWGSEQRVVTVRKFDPSLKTCVVRAIRAYSQNQHEYHECLTNVIALAYPSAGVQFYLIEGRPRKSIIEDFTGKDPRVWMRKLLQHIGDTDASSSLYGKH
ncbi:uncharacterized protein BXZ73DRAFT_103132 [Epithele typhae]|uniref:uncharacterized protein n=1 Tax=Epithele typhae TaxID=378194 RepID=UPI00200763AA|nr:uncharacterized protein BXZ73DRAFT_103132 [Epithele typhae]KAH9925595.1 hypothetical protein BXZ73DRAFT_103132 [Epithele typhae]